MATGITSITPFNEYPYLTVTEFKNAPTSLDIDNLVVGGNAQAQDAELARVILRASSFLDEYLNQNLSAQSYTETQRTRFTPQGFIGLHPNNSPVLALESFQYGADPNNLVTLPDCSKVWFESQLITIPVSQLSTTYSSAGPLSFGGAGSNANQIFTKYTYTAGYVNNAIATATQGATSMTVSNAAGILPNGVYRIYDGASSEQVTVASNYVFGSTTVPLTSALLYTHAAGVTFGNLPNAIKEATILVTTAFLRARGDTSLTMSITTFPQNNVEGNQRYGNEIALALQMVNLYRRVR
jgi:hypothetical protein